MEVGEGLTELIEDVDVQGHELSRQDRSGSMKAR